MTEWMYEHEGLHVRVSTTSGGARIEWKGVSDSCNPGEFLNPLITDWSGKLKNLEVTVDLSELDYMNSATIKPLINLVKLLDGNGQRVLIRFRDVDWQRTHRNCMSVLARTLRNTQVQ